jgi:hypothetical protein
MSDLFTENELVVLLNERFRRFVENPAEYEHEWETIIEFLSDEENEDEPSYGKNMVAELVAIRDED